MGLQRDIKIPSEGIRLQVPNTKAFIANKEYGNGILCVAESNLIWKLDNDEGLCLEYPGIALHAISSDLNAFPHECLYVMLDSNILEEENNEENEEDDEDQVTEIRFVPQDKSLLNPLFLAMNDCQALYPDEMSGDEQDGNEIEGLDQEEEYENGAAHGEEYEGQYDDNEEDMGEN